MRLRWDDSAGTDGHGLGMADDGAMRVRLGGRPVLAFDFDAIDYDDVAGVSSKTLAGETTTMTAHEAAAVSALLTGYKSMNNASVAGPRP